VGYCLDVYSTWWQHIVPGQEIVLNVCFHLYVDGQHYLSSVVYISKHTRFKFQLLVHQSKEVVKNGIGWSLVSDETRELYKHKKPISRVSLSFDRIVLISASLDSCATEKNRIFWLALLPCLVTSSCITVQSLRAYLVWLLFFLTDHQRGRRGSLWEERETLFCLIRCMLIIILWSCITSWEGIRENLLWSKRNRIIVIN
jgi:hypothetical protein